MVPAVPEADIERAIDQVPTIAGLAAKLAQQQEQYESQKNRFQRIGRKPTDPSLSVLHTELIATERSLANLRKKLRPLVIRQLQGEGRGDQVAQGSEIEQELAMLTEVEQRLRVEIAADANVNQSLTKNTLELQADQEEIIQLADTAAKVSHEVEALKVELEAPPRIRSIEDAAIPRVRDEKKRYMMIGVIVLSSFFGGLFGIAFLELQSRKVDTADEVPAELGLAVVGALPILPSRTHRVGAIARRTSQKDAYWQNLLLESIDATRTMLVHAARTGSHRVVMITSAVGGEGKTSLASYLATSLARSGLRTLLIDADLRSPAIHRLFDLSMGAGLSELIRGEVGLADVIADTAVRELKVLVAGHCDRQAVRVLAQGGLGPLLGQLKEQFDFVIVDSSPILPVADAMLIAQQVDAVLFSIFREVSRKSKVAAAIQRLGCLGVPVLGAVVTGAHGDAYGAKGYGYGSAYTYATLPESAHS